MKLALILALALAAKLSFAADCHGAAALICNKFDESHASMHIDAVMQCDDGRAEDFKSREAVIAMDTPRGDVAKLIIAMAEEVVAHFELSGIHNDTGDLIKNLKLRPDELPDPFKL